MKKIICSLMLVLTLITGCAPVASAEPNVYVTDTGACYHRRSCKCLKYSHIRMPLSQAKQEGFRPCKICRPPYESYESKQERQSYIVYGTRTGNCYHRSGCRYLRNSCIPMEYEQAIKRGLRPCSVCRP